MEHPVRRVDGGIRLVPQMTRPRSQALVEGRPKEHLLHAGGALDIPVLFFIVEGLVKLDSRQKGVVHIDNVRYVP